MIHDIDFYKEFKDAQHELIAIDADYAPLNIACVFSPPAEGNKDITQIQEDLEQERLDIEFYGCNFDDYAIRKKIRDHLCH